MRGPDARKAASFMRQRFTFGDYPPRLIRGRRGSIPEQRDPARERTFSRNRGLRIGKDHVIDLGMTRSAIGRSNRVNRFSTTMRYGTKFLGVAAQGQAQAASFHRLG